MMDEPSIRLLDSVHIDDDRQYVEFRFRGFAGEREAVQIDFEYVESLAAIFQQAFVSAALETQQGSTRQFGPDWLSVPRVDVDHPVGVAVDIMASRVVAMFLLGSPFQVSYALKEKTARQLATALLAACDQLRQQTEAAAHRPVN
jgi:hypothetical protein